MAQEDLEALLRSILLDLRPYGSDLILIGGWVPYLYRRYGGFPEWGGASTLTYELDVLVPDALGPEGRSPLAELLREAGFSPQSPGGPAAVWVRDVEAGEKIEFITPHRGTARGQGGLVPLGEQPGVAAIPLTDIEVLANHTQLLALPPTGGMQAVEVRVPALGAYVLNKAVTFPRRGGSAGGDGTFKMAKDLLYLADLMASGGEVVAAIVADLDRIARGAARDAERVRTGASNLRFAVDGHLQPLLRAVAEMVNERDAVGSLPAEEARLRGLLLDLREILTECADRHAPIDHAGEERDGDAE